MDDGKLAEIDSPDVLIKKENGGIFAALWKQHESTIDSALKNVLDPKVILKNAAKAASAAAGKDE